MRSGGRYSGRFATTVDYVAKKARIDRGDKADLIDNEGFEGRPTIRRALATLGTIKGYHTPLAAAADAPDGTTPNTKWWWMKNQMAAASFCLGWKE